MPRRADNKNSDKHQKISPLIGMFFVHFHFHFLCYFLWWRLHFPISWLRHKKNAGVRKQANYATARRATALLQRKSKKHWLQLIADHLPRIVKTKQEFGVSLRKVCVFLLIIFQSTIISVNEFVLVAQLSGAIT